MKAAPAWTPSSRSARRPSIEDQTSDRSAELGDYRRPSQGARQEPAGDRAPGRGPEVRAAWALQRAALYRHATGDGRRGVGPEPRMAATRGAGVVHGDGDRHAG